MVKNTIKGGKKLLRKSVVSLLGRVMFRGLHASFFPPTAEHPLCLQTHFGVDFPCKPGTVLPLHTNSHLCEKSGPEFFNVTLKGKYLPHRPAEQSDFPPEFVTFVL